ncbi:Panacea domain-containing protein [Lederbergia wuyishanensis]|uniref:Phage-associated protein n=1 Tax=Lederbergia wuyishanensis TaxID=1347903 RepID=A0ABU0D712_9BACI|nr:type II toxin-antitoxin system antitoxin SocA domain-containing protein [Lederbergia wuyishanensis]MCJ8008884.1 DUF4065 domain-containing protein [Lederbergia wuyishanensis]MDQ0344207.1 putative phage-associated protein [Lederbergia wuyishanensis]
MSEIRKLAQYLVYAYEKYTSSHFENSELKLQKMLYLAQRESLALYGETLYDEDIQGWVHGPVIPEIRFFFEDDYSPISTEEIEVLPEFKKYIIDNVIDQYAKYETWSLRDLTHEEYCWKKSREGLQDNEPGDKVISVDDIKVDAEKVRQYDHQWGMFLDEFEDDEGDVHVQ